MATLSKLYVSMGFKDDGYSAGIEKSKKQGAGLASFLTGAISTAGGFLLANMIARVAASVGGMVTAGMDFGREMANVNSIAQLSDAALSQLGDSVINIAKDPRISQGPAELAAGLYNIYSSGFQGAEGLNVLKQAAMAATAGVTDSETAARVGAAALNAYGLSGDQAGRIFDVLFQTVNDGVISFDELANNMGNTLPVAASLGVQIEELGAAYALMTLKGVGASAAETQISALMRSALAPTDALTSAVQSYGYESAEALVRTEGLAGLLKVLGQASGGSQSELLKLLGTQEAMNAATILGANGAADYTAELEKMNGASADGGATQRALEKQMKSAAYQIGQAKKQALILATTIFRALEPSLAKAAKGFAVFISVLTTLASYFIFVLKDGDYLNDFLVDLPEPLRGITAAVGDVVSGIRSFIASLVDAFQEGTKVSDLVAKFPAPLQGIAEGFLRVYDAVGDLIERWGSKGFDGMLQILPDRLRQALDGVLALVGGLVSLAVSIAIDTAVAIGGWLWEHRDDIWGGIKAIVGWTTNTFTDAITATVSGAISLAGDLLDAQGRFWMWVKGKLYGTTPDATGGPNALGQLDIPLGTVLVDGLLELGEKLKGIASDFGAWMWPKLKGAWGGVIEGGTIAVDAIVVIHGQQQKSDSFARSLWNGLVDAVKATTSFVGNIASAIVDAITSLQWARWITVDTFNISHDVATAIRGAIVNGIPDLVRAIVGIDWSAVGGAIIKGLLAMAAVMFTPVALGGAFVTAVVSMIAGAITGLVLGDSVDFGSVATKIRNGIVDAIRQSASWAILLITKGGELIEGVVQGLTDKWSDVVTFMVNAPTWAFNAMGVVIGTLLQKGRDLIQGLWDGAVEIWISIGQWFSNRASAATTAIGDLSRTLYSKGASLLEGMWSGMTSQWDSITTWLEGRAGQAVSWIGDLSNTLWGAGSALMNGLWNGMKAVWESIKGWLSGLNPAQYKGPPARDAVMLLEAGELIMGGLSKGMSRGWSRVEDQLSGYSALMSGRIAGDLVTSAQTSGSPSTPPVYLTVNQYIDGSKDARAVADESFALFKREYELVLGGA